MVQVVTLAEAKAHCRVTNANEDGLITMYIKAAGEYIESYINRSIPGAGESPDEIPFMIKAAALMLIEDFYDNRTAQIVGTTSMDNPAVNRMIYPFRVKIGI